MEAFFRFSAGGATENGQEDTMVTSWLAANAVKTRLKATSGDTKKTPCRGIDGGFSSSDGQQSLGLPESSVELLGKGIDVVPM